MKGTRPVQFTTTWGRHRWYDLNQTWQRLLIRRTLLLVEVYHCRTTLTIAINMAKPCRAACDALKLFETLMIILNKKLSNIPHFWLDTPPPKVFFNNPPCGGPQLTGAARYVRGAPGPWAPERQQRTDIFDYRMFRSFYLFLCVISPPCVVLYYWKTDAASDASLIFYLFNIGFGHKQSGL